MLTLSEHQQIIQNLLAENRIEDARNYCRRLSHPTARLWLSDINRLFPLEQPPDEDTPSSLFGPLFDGEVSPEWRAALDWPVEWVEVEILDKEKHEAQTTINYWEWLGCIGFYLEAIWKVTTTEWQHLFNSKPYFSKMAQIKAKPVLPHVWGS